jgi:hypothetical protein
MDMENYATKWMVGIKSTLRAIVTIAAAIAALDQAGLLDPSKLATVKGIIALAIVIAAKFGTSVATAKDVKVITRIP